VSVDWNCSTPVHCDRSSLNHFYILCTSDPNAEQSELAERFGKYFVRISDPLDLCRRIEVEWRKRPYALAPCLIAPVAYNKGMLLAPAPGLLPPVEYSYSQKPNAFEAEREFRYVLTCTADASFEPDSHLTLSLSDCRDICSLVLPDSK